MRFVKDGPSIPGDLLIARDEGRVVFFCGAGVSRARAELPDFFGLANRVIKKLGVSEDSPAKEILDLARDIGNETKVTGLFPVDKVFGLLEREFDKRDIESNVAKILKPVAGVDLSAHKILLDLAKTPEGKTRLVTTNFDRLFEDCSKSLKAWKPLRLPNPSQYDEMDGVIHLHGLANEGYTGAEGDGFILSSSDFGRAYLSDGWATEFIREVLEIYSVVFVGYAADDPPVQYLLEALNKQKGRSHGGYAFQSGFSNEDNAKWFHKGVEAIQYEDNKGHEVLWKTLEAWAKRANSPEEWFQSVIDNAKKGPTKLQPYERGQVAHLMSTIEGARKFSEGGEIPPAEWLCVFDPLIRYGEPYPRKDFAEAIQVPIVDPFYLYHLDDDIIPEEIDPDNHRIKRIRPPNAWDCFSANRLDRQNLQDDKFSAIRGNWAKNVPRLPSRLSQIGDWIAKVADQPAAVWWAAKQSGLHPDIQFRIQRELNYSSKNFLPKIRKSWQFLFEIWELNRNEFDGDWYDLKASIDKGGWDGSTVRRYIFVNQPHLKLQYVWADPIPPEKNDVLNIGETAQLQVDYPHQFNDIDIPDEWLAVVVRGLRKNLEHALNLETEILKGFGLSGISPIVPENKEGIEPIGRDLGLSGSVISFAALFERLVKLDLVKAKDEFQTWLKDDDKIFARLRIWASGIKILVSEDDFLTIMMELNDNNFWDSYHRRDLLFVLAKRWCELQEPTRKEIENRIIRGPARYDGAEDSDFEEWRAQSSLIFLLWLASNGCGFTFVLEAEATRLQGLVPNWNQEYALGAAGSMEGGSYRVHTETEHSMLRDIPLDQILTRARELSGRTEDYLIEKNPFAGLSDEHPVRAFSALSHSAKLGEYPEQEWNTFLYSRIRNNYKPKISLIIAERLSSYPNQSIVKFIRSISEWFSGSSKYLASNYPSTFDKILLKIIEVLRLGSEINDSSVNQENREIEWVSEALNASAGYLAQVLLEDLKRINIEVGNGLPAKWLENGNNLLLLNGDHRRHALTIFAHNMNWLYSLDPEWTKANMLIRLDELDKPDTIAIWSGFFWGATTPIQDLYLQFKPNLMKISKQNGLLRRKYGRVLAGMILEGWGTTQENSEQRLISNIEMRDILLKSNDEFRSQIIWEIEKWSLPKDNGQNNEWEALVFDFFTDVWPLQKSVKTPKMSDRLCHLAFSDVKRFPKILPIILPLLSNIDRESFSHQNVMESKNKLVKEYPQQILEILDAVLSDQVEAWPYGIDEILNRIGEANESLKSDKRLVELKRKWNSR